MKSGTPVATFAELSPTQLRVAERLAVGVSCVDIARELECSPKTISSHRDAIIKRLSLAGNVDLARRAIAEGLAPHPVAGRPLGETQAYESLLVAALAFCVDEDQDRTESQLALYAAVRDACHATGRGTASELALIAEGCHG